MFFHEYDSPAAVCQEKEVNFINENTEMKNYGEKTRLYTSCLIVANVGDDFSEGEDSKIQTEIKKIKGVSRIVKEGLH